MQDVMIKCRFDRSTTEKPRKLVEETDRNWLARKQRICRAIPSE